MTEATPVPPPAASASHGRSIAAAVCLVLAAILTVPASFAYWGQRTINDGQRYVQTVGPLVDSPEVQTAVATRVSDAIKGQVDVEALLNQAFAGVTQDRPRLQLLIGPLAGAVNGLIETQVRNFIASGAFRELWLAANTKAQEALIRVLEGDQSGAVSLQGGALVLDLSEVIDQVKTRLVDRGLTFLENAPDLPAANKQIVLLDSPQLKQVRTIYAFSNPVARWLIVVVAVLYLGGLLLSRRRPRTTVVIGTVLAANALLVALLLTVGRQLFINELSGTVFGPASTVFYDTLLSYLQRGQRVLFWLGLILVAIGWFVGRTRLGISTRTTARGALESIGASLGDTSVAGAGRWTLANAAWLRIVAGALGVVVLLWGGNLTVSRLFWSFVLVSVLLALIQVLVGTGHTAGARGDDAEATPTEPEHTLSPPTGGSA